MLIIEGDRHITSKQPLYQAHLDYNEWILSQDFNAPGNVFLSQGDLHHTSNPDPWEYAVSIDFVERSKFDHIYIIAGNHEYSRAKDRYALYPLEKFENVTVLYKETVLTVGELKILALPYYYPNIRSDVGPMETWYSSLHETEYGNTEYDYILGHLYFTDSFGSWCDLSGLKANRKVFGHDHTQLVKDEGEYIGQPFPTSYTQRGQQGHLILVDTENREEEYVDVPKLFDYGTVQYPDSLPETEARYVMWDVENAVDKDVVVEHYRKQNPNFVYRELRRKSKEPRESEKSESTEELWSISDWLDKFLKNTDKSERVQKIVREKMEKTA